MYPENYLLEKFGISEIYFHKGFTSHLLEKLFRQSEYSLDGEDNIALKYASHDILFIFNKQVQSSSIIYRFLKTLAQDKNRDNFIESNTLINEGELFAAIKSKTFVLVTPQVIVKDTYVPST